MQATLRLPTKPRQSDQSIHPPPRWSNGDAGPRPREGLPTIENGGLLWSYPLEDAVRPLTELQSIKSLMPYLVVGLCAWLGFSK